MELLRCWAVKCFSMQHSTLPPLRLGGQPTSRSHNTKSRASKKLTLNHTNGQNSFSNAWPHSFSLALLHHHLGFGQCRRQATGFRDIRVKLGCRANTPPNFKSHDSLRCELPGGLRMQGCRACIAAFGSRLLGVWPFKVPGIRVEASHFRD